MCGSANWIMFKIFPAAGSPQPHATSHCQVDFHTQRCRLNCPENGDGCHDRKGPSSQRASSHMETLLRLIFSLSIMFSKSNPLHPQTSVGFDDQALGGYNPELDHLPTYIGDCARNDLVLFDKFFLEHLHCLSMGDRVLAIGNKKDINTPCRT